MQRVKYVLVAFLVLSFLALTGEVPAEQAAAQEVFELKGDFDPTQFEGEGGTVTANEITLFIPAEGGAVIGQVHLRVEEFPFLLNLDFFSDGPLPYPDCKVTFDIFGTLTGTYNVETLRLNGTTQITISIPEVSDCGPEGSGELGDSTSDPWEGTFDSALQFAQGTMGAQDPEDPPLEFSAVVVGTSGPEENEEPPGEPGATEEEEAPTPTLTEEEAEQAVLDSLFGSIDLTLTNEQLGQIEETSRGAEALLRFNFRIDEPTPIQRETAALLGLAHGLSKLEDPEGIPLFPSFRGIGPVIGKLGLKAMGWDPRSKAFYTDLEDPAARVALERFIHFVAAMDQAARGSGGR